MKKAFLLLMILSLTLLIVAGCEETPIDEEPEEGGVESLGMGVVTSIGRSKDLDEENDVLPLGQVDSVIAAATFDQEGKVVEVSIDTAQVKIQFDEDLQLVSDPAEEILTKKELGDDYGMRDASEIDKEWDEQIAALEEWMVGKTVEEITSLELLEDGAPDDSDLVTSVTITVTDYIAALDKAYANSVNVQPGAEALGLGHNISIGRSTSLDSDNDTMPTAQADVVIAAAVFDDADQVAGVMIDTAQTRVNFDEEGQVTSDPTVEYPTKKELGDEYGMRDASEIDKEWDEQIAALEEWMVGKTVEEITSLELLEDGAPDDSDLVTSVTITVTSYLEALDEAYSRAR
ncbi:MAG: hypothetical protein R6U91_03355 [Bacillota bacterium]